jgi:hypothetical protein
MAKITATFDQRTTRDGYAIGVTISEYPDTDPSTFSKCLVVHMGDSGGIVRAATLLDMYNYLDTGYTLDHLSCAGLFETLEVGDIFHFTYIPEVWATEEGSETLDLTVTDVTNRGTGSVKVDTSLLVHGEFACGFAGELEFSVTRDGSTHVASSSNSIIAGRYPLSVAYTESNQVLQNYYRVSRSITVFPEVTDAANKVASLKAELQSLVNDSNTAGTDFVIVEEEVFE